MGLGATLARIEALHPRKIDLSLDRLHRLLAALGHPERSLPPVIHVAGTNGKGSVVAFLRAIAEAEGLAVDAYTSPHLVRFNERIRRRGRLIDDDALIDALDRCERTNAGRAITFFELTTAAAFLIFARSGADLLVLETGLGGRLDATNVVARPLATVITPISHDHAEFLGDDLIGIAREKAGIMKPEVPCLIARQAPSLAQPLIARAEAVGARAFLSGDAWNYRPRAAGFTLYPTRGGPIALPAPGLPGAHQIDNAALAAATLVHLADSLPIGQAALGRGIRSAEWPGRLQTVGSGRLFARLGPGSAMWLDGGHNPAAAVALAQTFGAMADRRPLVLVFGMMAGKSAAGFLSPLAHACPIAHLYAVTIPGQPNAQAAESLAAIASRRDIAADTASSLDDAFAMIGETYPAARVLVTGSLYLVGKAIEASGIVLD